MRGPPPRAGVASALTKYLPTNGSQSTEPSGIAPVMGWSILERAAIGELVDLGTALAVPYLAELTGDAITLGCSPGSMQSRRDSAHQVQQHLREPVAGVIQRFSGSFGGDFTLLVPERLRIAVSGGAIFKDGENDPAFIAVARFGEVLLTQCLAGFASTLGLRLDGGSPATVEGFPYDVVLKDTDDPEEATVSFSLDFEIDGRPTPAVLLISITDSSESPLKRFLHEFLAIEAGPRHNH